jgi:hypothetical protein
MAVETSIGERHDVTVRCPVKNQRLVELPPAGNPSAGAGLWIL